jgi:hypothetical protein
VLITSCLEAGIENILSCFPYIESLVMWIDPGEVAVKTAWSYSHVVKEEVIYSTKPGFYPRLITSPHIPFSKPSSQAKDSSHSLLLRGPAHNPQDKDVPYYQQQFWMYSEENVIA